MPPPPPVTSMGGGGVGGSSSAAAPTTSVVGGKRPRSPLAELGSSAGAHQQHHFASPPPPVRIRTRLANRAMVVTEGADGEQLGEAIAQPLAELQAERRRVMGGDGQAMVSPRVSYQAPRGSAVHLRAIRKLLRPAEWTPPDESEPFFLSLADIRELCAAAEAIVAKQPTLLRLQAPIKVHGDLHGQFKDLCRLWQAFGCPSNDDDNGDLGLMDYLFLGDYVDRGLHSLETVTLLLALKVEHPLRIHLLRGNHESEAVNRVMGFHAECVERLGEEDGEAAWRCFNSVFNFLPLAATVGDRILCLHGGIGRAQTVAEIAAIQRPIAGAAGAFEGDSILTDLLWSDPTEHDSIQGIHANHNRGPGVVSFGPDTVREFCERNGLDLIVRGHECVLDGIERFASGHLITIFSATNYCGQVGNAGAVLVIGRDLQVMPKLIQPLLWAHEPPSPPTPLLSGGGADAQGGAAHHHHHNHFSLFSGGQPGFAASRSYAGEDGMDGVDDEDGTVLQSWNLAENNASEAVDAAGSPPWDGAGVGGGAGAARGGGGGGTPAQTWREGLGLNCKPPTPREWLENVSRAAELATTDAAEEH